MEQLCTNFSPTQKSRIPENREKIHKVDVAVNNNVAYIEHENIAHKETTLQSSNRQ